jgi:hypothetical protein
MTVKRLIPGKLYVYNRVTTRDDNDYIGGPEHLSLYHIPAYGDLGPDDGIFYYMINGATLMYLGRVRAVGTRNRRYDRVYFLIGTKTYFCYWEPYLNTYFTLVARNAN